MPHVLAIIKLCMITAKALQSHICEECVPTEHIKFSAEAICMLESLGLCNKSVLSQYDGKGISTFSK